MGRKALTPEQKAEMKNLDINAIHAISRCLSESWVGGAGEQAKHTPILSDEQAKAARLKLMEIIARL